MIDTPNLLDYDKTTLSISKPPLYKVQDLVRETVTHWHCLLKLKVTPSSSALASSRASTMVSQWIPRWLVCGIYLLTCQECSGFMATHALLSPSSSTPPLGTHDLSQPTPRPGTTALRAAQGFGQPPTPNPKAYYPSDEDEDDDVGYDDRGRERQSLPDFSDMPSVREPRGIGTLFEQVCYKTE